MRSEARRSLVSAVLASALWAPALLAGGCGDPPLECEPHLLREIPPFVGAAHALAETTFDLRAAVAFSCASLAGALGVENPPIVDDPKHVEDATVTSACAVARAALEEALATAGPITATLDHAACDFAAAAQVACEEGCASADCGSVEERCEPAVTKGICPGDCTGTCIMQSGSVPCDGSCEGTCQGSCSGTCGDDCVGPCEGVCTGLCFGACEDVPAGERCGGTCKGGCSTPLEEPTCEGAIAPTSCELPPICAEACEAHAFLGADCDRAALVVEGNDSMKAILEAHATPIFVATLLRGDATVERAHFIAEEGYARSNEAVYQAGCVYELGVHLLPTFDQARVDVVSLRLIVEETASIVALIEAAGS